MSNLPDLAARESTVRTRLRGWRAALRRTFVRPESITLLSLAPEDVARRLSETRTPTA